MKKLALSLAALLSLAGVSQGATTFRGDVDACVRYVNMVLPSEQSDAYVHRGTTMVTFFGSKRGSFEFDKCMDALGSPTVNLPN